MGKIALTTLNSTKVADQRLLLPSFRSKLLPLALSSNFTVTCQGFSSSAVPDSPDDDEATTNDDSTVEKVSKDSDEEAGSDSLLDKQLRPNQVVAELDRHIVGQLDAKRSVAIAMRNRWRRMQLSDELRKEVTPRNVLMVGPTGCGKTEVARRMAMLNDAPFCE